MSAAVNVAPHIVLASVALDVEHDDYDEAIRNLRSQIADEEAWAASGDAYRRAAHQHQIVDLRAAIAYLEQRHLEQRRRHGAPL